MADIAMISIEGVLAKRRDEGESFAISPPIMPGIKLMTALGTMFKLALVTDEENLGPVEHFLRTNHIRDHAYLMGRKQTQVTYDHRELRAAQLQDARGGHGLVIGLVVDPDPNVVSDALRSGLVGLVFAHPSYQRPEFRPDAEQGVKAWADIEAEMLAQKELKETDPRLTPGIGV